MYKRVPVVVWKMRERIVEVDSEIREEVFRPREEEVEGLP